MKYYILNDNNTISQVSTQEFTKWNRVYQYNRIVRHTRHNDILVSTAFLGIDHSFDDTDVPVLFETMIFGGDHEDFQERYVTYDEALAGHKEAVALVEQE